ncbi:MAG: hypothetical protein KF723_20750 [Rhizobiaceae bacterium]|nr:hypothetical protein [Rhizobiaceae bacterium]
MTAQIETSSIVNDPFGQPARRYDIPRLEPRRFTDEHPMAMFAVIVAAAFISMVMLPSQGPAQAAIAPAAADLPADAATGGKADRLLDIPADEACSGQAWGAETLDCLTVITREGTGEQRKIRLVVADQINSTTPNVF